MTEYQKYQLQWMIDHGHSLDELFQLVGITARKELTNDGGYSYDKIIDEAYHIFTGEIGFPDGEIWACKDEYEEAFDPDEKFQVKEPHILI